MAITKSALEMPRDIESEQWVLGACISIPDLIDECTTLLRPGDFFVEANGIVFRIMQEMRGAEKTIDQVSLPKRLGKDDRLVELCKDSGGILVFLIQLAQASPVPDHARHHAKVVREAAIQRGIIAACTESIQEVRDSDQDSNELLARAEARLQLVEDERLTDRVCHVSEAMRGLMDDLQMRLDGKKKPDGVSTGFYALDEILNTLRPEELIILAARPSMGKTALAANIAAHVAIDCGVPTLLISLEMSRLELADRILMGRAEISLQKSRDATLSRDERHNLVIRAAEIGESPFFIDDTPSRSIVEVCATARRVKRKHGMGLLVIDYLQLIEPDNLKDIREQQVARMSKKLKALARLLKIPVLCLAQLNRQVENRPNKIPRLSDLRETGSIEQDADVVLFVHREEYYLTPKDVEERKLRGVADIVVAKQRNGRTGSARLAWQQEFTRFRDAPQGTAWTGDTFDYPGGGF